MDDNRPRVTLIDIDIPFWRLVAFFIKASLAAIPATIVVSLVLMLIGMAFGFIFDWHGMMMQRSI